jgi:putative nucleotidyltransferase with HDIG domain
MWVLNLSRMTGEPFTARDLKLASALGFQASLALANSKHYTDLRRNLTGTIDSLVEAIEKLDQNQEGHSKRVAAHALAVGKGMRLPGAVLVRLKLAAMLHDIGKIGLPDNLPSHYQRTIIERHTRGGAEILKPIAHMKDIIEGVMFHHENYDGTGLPFRLKGNKIPIMARVIAVADAYDRYTKANQQGRLLRPVQALDRLKRDSGTRFDPHVVAVFLDTCVDLQDQGPAQASAADIFGPLVR